MALGASRDNRIWQGNRNAASARGSTGMVLLLSFQGSALERTAFEAPPRIRHAFKTQEAGASGALRPQAEPGDEC